MLQAETKAERGRVQDLDSREKASRASLATGLLGFIFVSFLSCYIERLDYEMTEAIPTNPGGRTLSPDYSPGLSLSRTPHIFLRLILTACQLWHCS